MDILKLFFEKRKDGQWAIEAMKPMPLMPTAGANPDFYPVRDGLFAAEPRFVGTIRSILGQSIVPIVAQIPGENLLRCLGTGFFVSCTGLLVTAAHVIIDPIERRYGGPVPLDDQTWRLSALKLGVMLPTNPVTGISGYVFRDIEWASFLAQQSQHPLPIEGIELKLTSDTALCKVAQISENTPYQPLTIVQSGIRGVGMAVGKAAIAIGYAGMQDVELVAERPDVVSGDFRFDLHVSKGKVVERFADNLEKKTVPTPGACFSASMKLPAGMSGSPIFDDERIYVHGVVSKGWEDETGPTNFGFGSMLAHSLAIPIRPLGGRTLHDLHKSNEHGIPKLFVPDA